MKRKGKRKIKTNAVILEAFSHMFQTKKLFLAIELAFKKSLSQRKIIRSLELVALSELSH